MRVDEYRMLRHLETALQGAGAKMKGRAGSRERQDAQSGDLLKAKREAEEKEEEKQRHRHPPQWSGAGGALFIVAVLRCSHLAAFLANEKPACLWLSPFDAGFLLRARNRIQSRLLRCLGTALGASGAEGGGS